MEKTFNIAELKSNNITATNPIIIPDWLLDVILSLCDLDREYSGQLICRDKIAEYPFLSATGTGGSVFPEKKIVFNNSPNYSTIEFHTHHKGLGDYWATRFSGGDLTTFSNRIVQEGDKYQHILFTPTNILTWGKFIAPDIRIGFGNKKIVENEFARWNDKYKSWQQ